METKKTKGTRTRQRIIQAAAELFAAKSFESVSVRAIGKAAGVDPALINHYFGSKEGLFGAVLDATVRQDEGVAEVFAGPAEELGARAVRVVERIWTSPAGPALAALMRRALSGHSDELRSFATERLVRRIAERLDGPEHERRLRASLAVTQMSGFVLARHLMRMEPLASLSSEEAVALVGPALQRWLTVPLDLDGPAD